MAQVFFFVFTLWLGSLHLSNAQDDDMCAKSRGVVYAHEKFCDYYYRCDRNSDKPILEMCPNGLAFAGYKRGIAQNCDYPFRVGCPEDKVMGQQPQNIGNCEWSYGIFAHESSCTRYWQCWNNTAALQSCPFSLLYNDKLHACDWADNVPDCQKHPICKDAPNGAVAIGNSCTRYNLCVGGYPRFQRCPAGLAFNRDSQRCELDYTVPGCEPPPPPPEASNDVDERNNGSASQANRDRILG